MPQFLLMLRDSGAFPEEISAEEIQAILERYRVWSEKAGVRGGNKLRDGEGRVAVRTDSGVAVTDGPYAESREVIGGYFLVEANDYDDALRLIEDCPHLEFGSIEIRQIEM
jgi:hypothetical protein